MNQASALAPIQLIVGLGNPGKDYQDTRHNAGAWFVEKIAQANGATLKPEKKFFGDYAAININGHKIHLLNPTTFMNASGKAVGAIMKFFKIPKEAILVAHDELDLDPGIAKLKFGGGIAGHNGLRDIRNYCTENFLRLRVGIGRPPRKGVEHVLNKPNKSEREKIDDSLYLADRVLPLLLKGELETAMKDLHTIEG